MDYGRNALEGAQKVTLAKGTDKSILLPKQLNEVPSIQTLLAVTAL
jgi:hypothetical protein